MNRRNQLLQKIGPCPRARTGVHHWLFTAALKLKSICPDENEQIAVITEAVVGCGRDVPQREIEEAVRNSRPVAGGQRRQWKGPRWPRLDIVTRHNISLTKYTLADLELECPAQRNGILPCTEFVIDALFPGNPLLCASPNSKQALTRSRESWRGFMANQQFIVPSPMSSVYGLNQAGDNSMRSLKNTGPRRFVVVEFDSTPLDLQAATLKHLIKFGRLVLVVHSGGRSLHGWFYCADWPDEKTEQFFKYAVSLGADPKLWTCNQYCRMPDGKRDTGVMQRVVYFNPKAIGNIDRQPVKESSFFQESGAVG